MGEKVNSGKRKRPGKGSEKGRAHGPGGICFCTNYKERIPHQRGVSCSSVKCPKCGHLMIREGLFSS